MRQQLLVAAVAIAGGLFVFGVWGPPHGFEDLPDQHLDFLAVLIGGVWLAGELFLLTRWLSRRGPVVRTPLGRFTFWAGIVSCLTLFTGFLLGWLALLLAPAGLVTGIITVVKEIRSRGGNDQRNLIGTILCISALIFLAA